MKQIILSIFTFLSLHALAQDKIEIADANAQKRTLNASFTAIHVSDGIDLYLTQASEASIAVSSSDEKYLERFKTVVEDGVLKIYFDNKGFSWVNTNKRKLKAYVAFKTLEKLQASSGADVILKSVLKVDKLQCSVSSGAHIGGQVDIGELDISQNSGAETEMSGKADKLHVDVSSGAIFKGFDLGVNFCEAKASSGAGVRVTVNKELNAKANSGGGIRYKGNAVIKDLSVDSGGVVKKASI